MGVSSWTLGNVFTYSIPRNGPICHNINIIDCWRCAHLLNSLRAKFKREKFRLSSKVSTERNRDKSKQLKYLHIYNSVSGVSWEADSPTTVQQTFRYTYFK
jgi:hypothetical protein